MKRLVCLHGFTGQPESWRPVLEALESEVGEVRSHCPFLLGHGPEPPIPAGRGFEDEVDRLAAGIAAAAMEGSHLLAYSMGARLGLGLLLRHRRLFRGATLIGVHGGITTQATRRERARLDDERARFLHLRGLEAFLESWERLPLFASQGNLAPEAYEEQRRLRRGHRAAGLATALQCLGPAQMPDYHGRLADLRLPVTLMAGAMDGKFVQLALNLVEILPMARCVTVPEAGHNVVLEAPRQVARTVAENLALEADGPSDDDEAF